MPESQGPYLGPSMAVLNLIESNLIKKKKEFSLRVLGILFYFKPFLFVCLEIVTGQSIFKNYLQDRVKIMCKTSESFKEKLVANAICALSTSLQNLPVRA